MSNTIITQVIEQIHDLPDSLQQEVLEFVLTLRKEQVQTSNGNVWDLLESLAGTVKAPPDWSEEHNHYLYGTPKRLNLLIHRV